MKRRFGEIDEKIKREDAEEYTLDLDWS